jgi:hypothetical protein
MLQSLIGSSYNYTYTTTTSSGSLPTAFWVIYFVVIVAIIVVLVAGLWKVFQKAGKPGWAAIIPVYSTWVLFEIVGYPGWWSLLSLIPIVNIFPAIMSLISYFKLGKLFGKSDVYSVMLVLFPYILLPILGFGKAQFQGVTNGTSPNDYNSGPVPPTPVSAIPPQSPVPPSPEPVQPPQSPEPPATPPVPPTGPITG